MVNSHPLKIVSVLLLLNLGCSDIEPNPDAGITADAGAQEDASIPTDAGAVSDAGQAPLAPTWAACRRAHLANELDETQRQTCTTHHTAPPSQQRMGLRWIFLGHDEATVASYPESQIDDLNAIFAPNNMVFFNHSRQRIINPVATEGAYGDTVVQLTTLLPDLQQLLVTDESDPQAILELLKSQLEAQGADLSARENADPDFRLTAGWRARHLHAAIARLHPDLITIVVRQAQGEKSTGSYPGTNTKRPFAGMIYLAQTAPLSALGHEMGHFFGLPHTHGTWSSQSGATQDWKRNSIDRIPEVAWQSLQSVAGDDYSRDFSQTYLRFDASEETIETFQEAQLLARRVLGWADLCYQGDLEPIADDASFIAMIRSGQAPKMKNFVRSNGDDGDFSGNNCRKNFSGDDRSTVFCKYGDGNQHQRLTVADAIVSDSLIFGEAGDEANLMSYISTNTSDGVRRKKHLTTRQRDLIRLGSRMPSRQRLRNHAQ